MSSGNQNRQDHMTLNFEKSVLVILKLYHTTGPMTARRDYVDRHEVRRVILGICIYKEP